jgi:hypothetical protein
MTEEAQRSDAKDAAFEAAIRQYCGSPQSSLDERARNELCLFLIKRVGPDHVFWLARVGADCLDKGVAPNPTTYPFG